MSICYQLIFPHTPKASVKIVCPLPGPRLRKKCITAFLLPDVKYQDLLPAPAASDLKSGFGFSCRQFVQQKSAFLFPWKSRQIFPINKKVMIALVCSAQTKAKAPACGYSPAPGTWKPPNVVGHSSPSTPGWPCPMLLVMSMRMSCWAAGDPLELCK